MTDDDLERTLRAAFDARAREAVGDTRMPPPPRFAAAPPQGRGHRRLRVIAPVAAAAAVAAVAVSVSQLGDSPRQAAAGNPSGQHTTSVSSGAASRLASTGVATTAAAPVRSGGRPVHIKLANADGSTYGVGMPVIAYFSRQITDARSLSAATSILVNGATKRGAWYFERSAAVRGYPIEGHLRLATYWPAHAKVRVVLATKGVTAGTGLSFDDQVNLDFATGPATMVQVDDATHRLDVTEDGKPIASYPVSLGSAATPTANGIKVIMQKQSSVCMHDVAGTYYECNVKDAQRLTYDGEYLHAAPWNSYNIAHGIDSSNGCTNLTPSAAQILYRILRVGDVVDFRNANGPVMQMGRGYGDWNVSWSVWQTGGLVPTR